VAKLSLHAASNATLTCTVARSRTVLPCQLKYHKIQKALKYIILLITHKWYVYVIMIRMFLHDTC